MKSLLKVFITGSEILWKMQPQEYRGIFPESESSNTHFDWMFSQDLSPVFLERSGRKELSFNL